MKLAGTAVLRALGLVVLGALYYWLAHVYTAADQASTPGALLSIAPYMGLALLIAWRSRRRLVPLCLWAGAVVALALNWELLRANFSWIYLLQHAGSFALLAIAFGRSLAPGETPMISTFAARVHGSLPAPLGAYTRAVTQAWTLFFGCMLALSLLLFFGAPIAIWSWFANLLTPLLTAAMFVAEYLVRLRCLPAALRTGFVASIRAVFAPREAPADDGLEPSAR